MPWLQLTFYSTKEKAETLADLLSEAGAAAVTMQDAADQPLYEPPPGATPLWQLTNVVGLFAEDADGVTIVQQLQAQWQGEFPDYRSEMLGDQDWERAWMDDFKPMRFGERLWIVPSWHEPPCTTSEGRRARSRWPSPLHRPGSSVGRNSALCPGPWIEKS